MFEAVIFDWDGTLADTKEVVVFSFQKVLRAIGCRVDNQFIERRIGIGTKNTFKEALNAMNKPFDEVILNELVMNKIKIQTELTGNVRIFDGAIDILSTLRNRLKIALATMSNRSVIDKLLREKELRKYFDFVITADDVTKPKPNPEIFLKCATKLKCQPEKCVVVEDSIFGVAAAKEANMRCIAIASGSYSKEELKKQQPDLIINSIDTKEQMLNFLLGRAV